MQLLNKKTTCELFNAHISQVMLPGLGEQNGPWTSFVFLPRLLNLPCYRCIWFIQNCSVTSNFFNPKAIMKTCCLECWTLMYCLILLWEIRCIKLIRKLGCVYRQQNYSACALMLYTKVWNFNFCNLLQNVYQNILRKWNASIFFRSKVMYSLLLGNLGILCIEPFGIETSVIL